MSDLGIGPTILADTALGKVVVSDGIVYILTRCCNASGKGSGVGVVCRACYQQVPDHHGWGAIADHDTAAHQQHVLAGMLRPWIGQDADDVAAGIFTDARDARVTA